MKNKPKISERELGKAEELVDALIASDASDASDASGNEWSTSNDRDGDRGGDRGDIIVHSAADRDFVVCRVVRDDADTRQRQEDTAAAQFIAGMRSLAPKLVAELIRLQDVNGKLQSQIEKLQRKVNRLEGKSKR